MKKNFSFKKLLGVGISAIMCISAFPVAAMAADDVTAEQEGNTEPESNNVDNIKLFDEKGKNVSDGISIERPAKTAIDSLKYIYDLKIYDNGKEIDSGAGAYNYFAGAKFNNENASGKINTYFYNNQMNIYVNNKAEVGEYDLAVTVSKDNKELFTKNFKLTVLESSEDAESYGIAVSGITINKNNADDVLNNESVSYDVSENILHLNNVTIKNAPEKIALYTTKDLTLNLMGTNEINGVIGNDKKPTITLEGNGTLIHSEYTPIYADYIMKSGKLEINSTDAEETISMLGSLTVDGGNAEINTIQPVIQGGIVFKSGSLRYIGSNDISAQLELFSINTANDYWWRTSENGDWTKGGYSKPDGAIKYFEITDADPDIPEEKFEFTKQPSDLSDIAKGATAYVKFEINKPAEEVKLLKVGTTYNQEKYSMTNAPADTELSIPVSNTEEFEGSYTGTYVIRAYIGDGFYQSREFTITWVEKQPAVEHTVTAYGLYGETMGITPGEKYTMDYAVGERVALQIGRRSGYKLKGITLKGISESDISWYLKDSESKERGIVFDMPDNNVTVTVNWKRNSSSGGGSSLSSVSSTKYAVTSPSVENGEVIIDKANAAKGSDVTIMPKADEGYELGSIKATKSS